MTDKPLCIIPARGGSKRLPRKNMAQLAGKPLLAYTVEEALKSGVFDQVCVSSEDDEILEVAREYGAQLALKRPPELATDTAQIKKVCKYLLEYFVTQGSTYSEFAMLQATNPLRKAEDIKAAYEIFKREDANYVISIVPFSHPPQRAVWVPDGYVKPYFGLQYMKQVQLLDTLYQPDGSIIFAKTEVFLEEGEFYGSKAVPYFIPVERSLDIDSQLDLAWAEFLLSRPDLKWGAHKE
ncbi:cytidylyltransferase domain-containing protein [Chloroflexota bacterium]